MQYAPLESPVNQPLFDEDSRQFDGHYQCCRGFSILAMVNVERCILGLHATAMEEKVLRLHRKLVL